MNLKTTVGRYAPSPTGELHLGNLRTALLAWLSARLQDGQFLMRMEDLDTPRVVVGSADQILRDLEALGIDWDGEVVYQSKRLALYEQAIEELKSKDLVYPCFCSRKDLQNISSAPHQQLAAYPGMCAKLTHSEQTAKGLNKRPSLRLRVNSEEIRYADQVCGEQAENLSLSSGDFVVKRADGLFAYQLAVLVDDMEQGVTEVVRGEDLLSSTARQIYLGQILYPCHQQICYAHVPLLHDQSGARMAKRDGSISLQAWLAEGKTVDELIAHFARQLGLLQEAKEISAKELLKKIKPLNVLEALQA